MNNQVEIERALNAIQLNAQSGKDHIENAILGNSEFNLDDFIQCIEFVERPVKILLGILYRMKEEENEN